VVIPYYGAAAVVAEAVASALDQTLVPHEVVVCDDGSPDDLDAALGALRERVVVVRQPNAGAGAALNAAARAASGEFIAQLDADDLFAPERVEALSDAIVARPDLDIVATDALIELDGRVVARYAEATPFAVEDQQVEIVRRCFFAWPAMRRARFLEVGGFDARYRSASDWAGFLRLILTGSRAGMVDAPLYRWRLSPGSLTASGAFAAEEDAQLLEAVRARYDLAPDQRAVVDEAIADNRRRGGLLALKEALADVRPDARARALAVLAGPGYSGRTRAKAALAAAAPGLVGRRMARRFAEGGVERRFGGA
jgi:hypothetical protein